MVDRLTTFGFHRKTVNDITRTQSALVKLQNQITSGRKANTFIELGSEIGAVLDIESSIKSSDKFVTSNNIVLTRLRTMDVAVSQLEDLASELAQQLVLERSPSGSALNITEFAQSALSRIEDDLNTQSGGRFLFSGSKTDRPPIKAGSLSTTNIIANQPTANYYQGDSFKFSVQSSEQLSVEYGIVGNDVAFQNLIGALNFAIKGEGGAGTPSSDPDLERAVTLVNQAVSDLARVRNQINTDIVTLEGVNTQHGRIKLNLQDIFNSTVATDVVEASVLVQANQAVLTATLQTFARISQLSLTQFLR